MIKCRCGTIIQSGFFCSFCRLDETELTTPEILTDEEQLTAEELIAKELERTKRLEKKYKKKDSSQVKD